jgi:microcompartment protein CcmL/EutN
VAAKDDVVYGDALGFIEVYGLIAAVEAADAMGKAAQVRVKSVCNADAGLITVICEGDIAACKASVDAGSAAAKRLGRLMAVNLIARPYEDTKELITGHVGSMFETKKAPAAKPVKSGK